MSKTVNIMKYIYLLKQIRTVNWKHKSKNNYLQTSIFDIDNTVCPVALRHGDVICITQCKDSTSRSHKHFWKFGMVPLSLREAES